MRFHTYILLSQICNGGPITQDVLLFLKLWVQIEEIGVKSRWPIIVRSLQLVNRIINKD